MNSLSCQESYKRLKKRIVPTLKFNQTLYENVLDAEVSKGTVWLDAGGGHKILPSWRADAEREMVQRVQFACAGDGDIEALGKHQSLTHRVACDLHALPFKSRTFTLVSCNMVAEHLANPVGVFSEFARILLSDGVIIVHTPYRWSYFAILSSFIPQFIKDRVGILLDGRPSDDYFPVFYRCNTPNKLRRIMNDIGLHEQQLSMYASDAVFQFLANNFVGRIILSLELHLLRLSLRPGWRFLRLSICGVYRKVTACDPTAR